MAADPTAGLFFHPLFWLLRLPDRKLESSSCFPHLSQHTPHCGKTEECENSQAGPGRAGRANETKIFGFSRILKSRTSCYIAWLSWEKWMGVFAVISGCLQPLQLRLCEFAPRLCFQDSLLYLCLGRPFFLKWKLALQGNYGNMGNAACREIQAWNSQLCGSRADLDVCIFNKKPLKVT